VERLFPKDRGEFRWNQLPVAETADLRAAAITFCSDEKNWILDWVSVFAKVQIALYAISTSNTLNSFQCFDR
jgi:hypothetical protein